MGSDVRPMATTDVDMVLTVEQRCFSIPWSREAFETELNDNELAHYFVALADGQVVGYAGMWIILDEAHVTNVAVLPEYRNRNFGHKLMAALIGYAEKNGATCMTLEVRQSNDVARRLYESIGFIPRGLRRHYYTDTREDAVIMWLDDITQGVVGKKKCH